jgi:molybdopterin molybdotransferase
MNQPARAPLMALDDALAQLLAAATPVLPTESVPTFEADGRVLAQPLVSALHVPPARQLQHGWLCSLLRRLGLGAGRYPHCTAGGAAHCRWPHGLGAANWHGGTYFHGSTRTRWGRCHRDAGRRCRDRQRAGQLTASFKAYARTRCSWIRRAGEDVTRGAQVLAPGQRLGPAEPWAWPPAWGSLS